MTTLKTPVLIIGGGATGTGLLHSGARYVASDREDAMECREEGEILRRLAPQYIEDTGGLFVAVRGDDERYVADFTALCAGSSTDTLRILKHGNFQDNVMQTHSRRRVWPAA